MLVGLDVGTTSVKGLAVDPETGAVLARAGADYPLLTPRPGWSEQDPDAWRAASEGVLAELTRFAGRGAPAAIGLSGQMHGLVALGGAGRPLRPAILWNDQRTAAECAWITEQVGAERLLELAGNPALTGLTAPKLVWMARHEPELYRRIARVMLPKDYVRLGLTGTAATDVSDASGTLLFDVAHRRWSEELCAAVAVDPGWLAPALESAAVSGETAAGVPVAAGGGDQAAGAVGVGVGVEPADSERDGRPGPVSLVLGTSGVVFAALPRYAVDARLHVFCHAVPGAWHAMGVMLSAAGSLRWLSEALGTPIETLLAEAARWPPGCEGLLFAPYLQGERAPHPDPDARGAFVGLTLRHDRGAIARAVLEGVAFSLAEIAGLTAALAGPAGELRVSGGGARSRLWLEILATAFGAPIVRMEVDEGAAYGAAMLGGVAAGTFTSVAEAAGRLIRVRDAVAPRADWAEASADAAARFAALYPTLRALRPPPSTG